MEALRLGEPVEILCRDGVALGGHLWQTSSIAPHGLIVVNPATGVLARYYHYYARFLTEAGFDVLTIIAGLVCHGHRDCAVAIIAGETGENMTSMPRSHLPTVAVAMGS